MIFPVQRGFKLDTNFDPWPLEAPSCTLYLFFYDFYNTSPQPTVLDQRTSYAMYAFQHNVTGGSPT